MKILEAARALKSEDRNNPEYDRALVELCADVLGLRRDVVASELDIPLEYIGDYAHYPAETAEAMTRLLIVEGSEIRAISNHASREKAREEAKRIADIHAVPVRYEDDDIVVVVDHPDRASR